MGMMAKVTQEDFPDIKESPGPSKTRRGAPLGGEGRSIRWMEKEPRFVEMGCCRGALEGKV